jgi:hypothetical protein
MPASAPGRWVTTQSNRAPYQHDTLWAGGSPRPSRLTVPARQPIGSSTENNRAGGHRCRRARSMPPQASQRIWPSRRSHSRPSRRQPPPIRVIPLSPLRSRPRQQPGDESTLWCNNFTYTVGRMRWLDRVVSGRSKPSSRSSARIVCGLNVSSVARSRGPHQSPRPHDPARQVIAHEGSGSPGSHFGRWASLRSFPCGLFTITSRSELTPRC